MVSSSPEYSITKPGLHHHQRKREKPLRTYGRQTSTPEAQSEPPLKRQRLSALKQQEEKPISPADSSDDVPKLDDAASPKKSSILSYFKPAPQKPKDDPPSQSQGSPAEEPIAPQESPKRRPSKRKPRLLKIKATTHDTPHQSSQESDSHSNRDSLQNTNSYSTEPTLSSSTSPSPPPGQKKPLSKTRPPSIQTTLNISAQAAFSECKICNTVWNPLYPDDVKFHNKTHKAVLRAQKRKVDDL
ncbi:zinc-finger of acetyl-transferase ESCO domain-containing protein [Trichoderma breve]|uniref:Zinc-finger of acetyl-transferase ESCO domain-containing protein n=1 Tax=Trichoderma breve TaxID=2034170 RepID=A0A9W9BEK2_9HYPO|nr:zinc-finger of acetyl-transferase ESCO domain-containing protein [Trichoderma breve]KAJ4861700.1 zinc-finger of acetyl-transferase ESCO domain-containing protein [Trichoderma breve]